MLILIIVCIIGGCAYFACPMPIQLILTGLNLFIPDPIPYLDEIIMIGGILSKLYWLDNAVDNIGDFLSEHKVLCLVIVLVILYILGS